LATAKGMRHNEPTTEVSLCFIRLFLICLLLSLFASPGITQPAGSQVQKNVLVLFPDWDRLPGLAAMDQSIRAALASDPRFKIDVYFESLERSRFPDPNYDELLRDYFQKKYAQKRPDAIISILGPSLDFLLKYGDEVFPGTPIIFCGVDRREIESRSLGANMTGVLVKRQFGPTLDIALRLQPDTRKAIFIGGASSFDKRLTEQAIPELRPYEDRVEIEYLTDFKLNDLLARVSHLPPHTIILVSTIFNDNTGEAFVPHDVVPLISQKANVPVYGFLDQFLGRGIVGGHLYSLEDHGKKAAELALDVLGGQRAADLPIVEAESYDNMFDWRELRRWGLDENKLPVASVFRYREPSDWDRYKWYILGAVAIGLFQTFLISWLLLAQSRRRKAERERGKLRSIVLAEHQKMDAVVANVPVVVWESRAVSGLDDRRIGFISNYVEKMLGYTPDEIAAIPNFWRSIVLEDDLERLNDTLTNLFEGGKPGLQQFRCRTKDGAVIWVDAHLDTIQDEQGNILGLRGVAIDVTDRKESERALVYLGSKLITAQEEERSRVARELHDDLGQSLALLSINLDLLKRESGKREPFTKKVEQLADHINQLSYDVHRISHELHPAKIEQLGLEASLRSLCREISGVQPFDVLFEATNAPKMLPNDISLCLYRVAQESLQNVQKHSGASLAVVELEFENDFIRLNVSDNGNGFDPETIRGKESLGLISMRERIRSVHGTFAVKSRSGEGTHIKVTVPSPAPAAETESEVHRSEFI